MVKDSFKPIQYFLVSIRSAYKALLLNIGKDMNQTKTTFYNKE